MAKTRRTSALGPFDRALLGARRTQAVPHEFVLDALSSLGPATRSMFGCLAIYVGEKIVLILREGREPAEDNGVWLATTSEHHDSLRREFPQMRSVRVLGQPVSHWQILPEDAPDFEASALRACRLIRAQDPRIGKVPKGRRRTKAKTTNAKSRGSKAQSGKPRT